MEGKLKKEYSDSENGEIGIDYFEEIIQKNEKAVVQFAYTYVKDWSVAEDISQEVFIKVYKNFLSFDHRSKLKTWLFSITANECKDYLRKIQRRTKWWNHLVQGNPKQDGDTPETILLQNEEKNSIGEALLTLPVKYREVLVLYYYEDLSTEEISKLLVVNSSTVRSRLDRGRKYLKNLREGGRWS
ncbi:sigma-70 family RNA polymerase sigma factor [Bacillus sp. P14.5]|uniref:RNA polymerase sigma factor n=1 Tax=Bacillus sp. P14.5 TaxID=1983400 RepID=UPI000DEACDF3|nr:sigma-70 family RNA polymerase sigma factor [Bacillus sp. P14.5]